MRPDSTNLIAWILGFDIRVLPIPNAMNSDKPQLSMDPMVWQSLRTIDPTEAIRIYKSPRLADVSNGLNLFIKPPICEVPNGYTLVAFDGRREIIEYMCSSFGLQNSMSKDRTELKNMGFREIGYDVVDLWTQSSICVGRGDILGDRFVRNEFGLIQERDVAVLAASVGNELDPGRAPFQDVGVWIKDRSPPAPCLVETRNARRLS